jgi:hypothetical protein
MDVAMTDSPVVRETAVRVMSLRRQVEKVNRVQMDELQAMPRFFRCIDHAGLTRGEWTSWLQGQTKCYPAARKWNTAADTVSKITGFVRYYAETRTRIDDDDDDDPVPEEYIEGDALSGDKGINKQQEIPAAKIGTLKAFHDHRFGAEIELKKGALVMLLTNLGQETGLCNGSQGILCGWKKHDPELPVPKEYHGDHVLRQTLETKRYVERAMERELQNKGAGAGSNSNDVADDDKNTPKEGDGHVWWPVVRFHATDTRCAVQRTIYPDCQVTERWDGSSCLILCRTQVPLAPAWAMTIHKSQGQTLDRVVVNVDRTFEDGQAYVALSRARSLSGLVIEGGAQCLRLGLAANKEVVRFYQEKFGVSHR